MARNRHNNESQISETHRSFTALSERINTSSATDPHLQTVFTHYCAVLDLSLPTGFSQRPERRKDPRSSSGALCVNRSRNSGR
ncbi:Hypothetical predicted protein [Scomber scombrus]|uniref:Uncharacterized protein n=1 Tax=Scomber scombrus TaxID=13677 RepID=A0AAV1PRZ3_SCOSC